MARFTLPRDLYHGKGSLEALKSFKGKKAMICVGGGSMKRFGFLDKAEAYLKEAGMEVQIFDGIEPDPSVETVMRGADAMLAFEPDWIVAIGGGSPIDAAKAMWIKYEHPEITFEEMCVVFGIPELRKKARFCAIPSTSGTATEVTAFAVITDYQKGIKYPLADYSLVPSVAIIDPQFVMSLPKSATADTGLDVLTHALEAYVSMLATDYTDALAIQAIQMVFKYLPRCVKNGRNDLEAREKMHNASTMAGMAFANAFLGMNHSMAHKIGGYFHVPHGRTNAILLPFTIMYNGQVPQKLGTWPKYNVYDAHERYANIARLLGLKFKTVEEGVRALADAVYELGLECGEKMSFKEQGIDEKEWMDNAEELAYRAYEDQCTPANPRIPLVKDMKEILIILF